MTFTNKLLTVLTLIFPIIAFGQSSSLPKNPVPNAIGVNNFSFEKISPDNLPVSWVINSRAKIKLDSAGVIFGNHSLSIDHPDWESSEVVSDSIELQIGHLYKLSAWVKSENARTNPAAKYPTPAAGCLSMESFPFTNHSMTVGASTDWHKIEVQFIATKSVDCIRLHLGYNGGAKGKIWFDQIELEKTEDISGYIFPETVRWFNEGYRYDDQGWIFVHIEGKPYERGYQYGYLIAEEMVEYMNKLSIQANEDHPEDGWKDLRFMADGFMLRKYEEEYLREMKGITDGANKAGAKLFDRPLDLIDIVTMNSAIDIQWAKYAMPTTPHALSGQNFLNAEDELNIPNRLHKCSSFLANKSTTTDQRIVFGQIFMWWGYTGPHWNVVCDVVPEKGNRLVYETFPGGIHSGADFYINSSGIMIGETTVSQTPFNPDGSPQSNRIRKAAQYANSIDDVVEILTIKNNGMYANDWLIGDTKTDEIAVLTLGTYKHKLWRSSKKEFWGDTHDFYWCNNNNKDPEVRKEYIPNPDNAPFDLIFTPWNRDLAFNEMYQKYKGKFDGPVGTRILGSSPINRPHACDGKVTTSEMAEQLVFMAHSGKVTLREKFVGENRRIPDLPGAVPRLSLGYSVASPVFITEKLKEMRDKKPEEEQHTGRSESIAEIIDHYNFNSRNLWRNTVFPSSTSENWFVSGTAAYWNILNDLPESDTDILPHYQMELAGLSSRYLYVVSREGTLVPRETSRIYNDYKHYQIPRIKGTYVLHQLHLLLGEEIFGKVMNAVHNNYREKEMKTRDFIKICEKISGQSLKPFIEQWISRDDIPTPEITATIQNEEGIWQTGLEIRQTGNPYHFLTSVEIKTTDSVRYHLIEVKKSLEYFTFTSRTKPSAVIFNALNDIPVNSDKFYTWSNLFDDFHETVMVYGTSRQNEANHTLAGRFSTTLADRFTENLIPLRKDSEISQTELSEKDLIVIGHPSDNQLMADILKRANVSFKKNLFEWEENEYSQADDGLFLALPNPYNSKRVVYLFITNSALQLYQMTKNFNRMPSWAIYKGDRITEKGYHQPEWTIKRFD